MSNLNSRLLLSTADWLIHNEIKLVGEENVSDTLIDTWKAFSTSNESIARATTICFEFFFAESWWSEWKIEKFCLTCFDFYMRVGGVGWVGGEVHGTLIEISTKSSRISIFCSSQFLHDSLPSHPWHFLN